MTTRPHLKLGRHLLPGIVAIALFVVLAVTFLTDSFPAPQGFSGGPITATLGYSILGLDAGAHPVEGFLAAFEIIDLVLIAALASAVMLAKTEENGRIAGALRFGTDDSTDDADDSAVRADGGEDR